MTNQKERPGGRPGQATIFRATDLAASSSIIPHLARFCQISDVLELVDLTLTLARKHKAEWLLTRDPDAWRAWQSAEQDRALLLAQLKGERHD